MDLMAGLARTVGGAVTALRRRQELEEQLAIRSHALETSSAAMVWFTADRAEPTITPSAARLLAELREGPDILYRILRDTGTTEQTHRSYLVRLRDGAKDVLDCTVRAVPEQPGAEVLELTLETTGGRYVDDRLSSLSAREHDVAELVAAGLSDKQIAARLTLSLYTVRQHVKSIYTKLQISNRVHLTRMFLGRTASIDPL
ncbi:hypothetical protein BJF78_12160 [Pseudonocardia sp. CNS-139]|nr:hypothetical protein BJF78_12160 [Pseudonocardia sp. CNS-139]